jgi:hypothetical protein
MPGGRSRPSGSGASFACGVPSQRASAGSLGQGLSSGASRHLSGGEYLVAIEAVFLARVRSDESTAPTGRPPDEARWSAPPRSSRAAWSELSARPRLDIYCDVGWPGAAARARDRHSRSQGAREASARERPRPSRQRAARVSITTRRGRFSTWAAGRRVRGCLGSSLWRGARFWSRRELAALAIRAGLRVLDVRGTVFFPPSGLAARLAAPLEATLTCLHAPGGALLVLAADRPGSTT